MVFTAARIGLAASALNQVRKKSLRDKVVFISGGSRGLGLALASQFADRGADIAICGRRHDELQRAVVELRSKGTRVLGLTADFTAPEHAEEVIDRIRRHFGRLDVVVNTERPNRNTHISLNHWCDRSPVEPPSQFALPFQCLGIPPTIAPRFFRQMSQYPVKILLSDPIAPSSNWRAQELQTSKGPLPRVYVWTPTREFLGRIRIYGLRQETSQMP